MKVRGDGFQKEFQVSHCYVSCCIYVIPVYTSTVFEHVSIAFNICIQVINHGEQNVTLTLTKIKCECDSKLFLNDIPYSAKCTRLPK